MNFFDHARLESINPAKGIFCLTVGLVFGIVAAYFTFVGWKFEAEIEPATISSVDPDQRIDEINRIGELFPWKYHSGE